MISSQALSRPAGSPVRRRNERLTPLRALFLAYIIFLPVQLPTPFDIRIAPSDFCLALYLCLSLGRLRIAPSTWSVWHAAVPLIFLIGTLITTLQTGRISQYVLINKLIGLAVLFAAYAVVTAEAADWRKLRSSLRFLILTVAFQNLFALLAYYHVVAIPLLSDQIRLAGMLIDPNAYGGLLTTALLLHVTTSFGGAPLLGRWLGLAVTLSLALGVLLTFSRSAWIGGVLGVLFVSVFRQRIAIGLAFSSVAAAILMVLVSGQGFLDHFVYMASRQRQIDARMDIITEALTLFSERPFFGLGLGEFAVAHGNIVHNTPLWFLTEFGLIGFVVYIGFTLWFVLRALESYRLSRGAKQSIVLGLAAAYLCIAGLSLGIEALYQRHGWFIAASIASCYALLRQDRAERAAAPAARRPRTGRGGPAWSGAHNEGAGFLDAQA